MEKDIFGGLVTYKTIILPGYESEQITIPESSWPPLPQLAEVDISQIPEDYVV